MGTKRNALIGAATIATFIAIGMMANAQEPEQMKQPLNPSINYSGFLEMTDELKEYREARLVSLDTFNEMKADSNTIILDTRSKWAYDLGHIEGAIHLNFSDFVDSKLADVIPSKDTRILIYCNNNFDDNWGVVVSKRPSFALNIPTFINLYGYGYENIYELNDLVSIADEGVNWTGDTDHPFGRSQPSTTVEEN